MATLEIINIGTSPNDGAGDPLRTAFSKVNNNFANLWATGFSTQDSITDGNTTQSIFEWPANAFTQATFQINSSDNESTNSQGIVINASINGALDSVRFTAHSTTFHGNAVTNYSMDVVDDTVFLYVTPLVSGQMSHFIAYQVTYNPLVVGTSLSIESNPNTVIVTETTGSVITTEG
jgi:hypothetical protein